MASSIFKSSMGVSFATFLSRILGLVRDVLFAATIGGGLLMSAWTTAEMIPNLLRRLLGEGALGSALVPMITGTMEKDGLKKAREDFSTVVIWLFFLLALITVLVSAAALIAYPFFSERRYQYVLLTTPIIMPYCIFICMIGVFTSILNSFKLFFWPAVSSLSLNIFLIGGLFFICPHYRTEPLKMLAALSVTLLASGAAQLIFLTWLLKTKQMLPVFSWKTLWNKPAIREIVLLTLPGLFGAGVLELGSIIDQTLSLKVGDYGAASIYYSNRLVYLPIGVFAVAFGSVSLPYLSKLVVEKKIQSMLIQVFRSMRQLLFITVPMGMFLIFFGMDAIAIIFRRGCFDGKALEETHLAFLYLTLGIPAFAAVKITLTAFYSRKKMVIPAVTAAVCVLINFCLSLILMRTLRQGGLTLATSLSSYLNNIILLVILKRTFHRLPIFHTVIFFLEIACLSFIAAVPALGVYKLLAGINFHLPGWVPFTLPQFIGAGCVFCCAYFILAMVMRIHESEVVLKKLLRRR